MRIRFALTACAFITAVSASSAGAAVGDRAAALERELGPGARVAEHRETGRVRFIGTAPGDPIARPRGIGASAAPTEAARAFLNRHEDALGIRDQERELRVSASERVTGRGSAVRFQQLQDDVPVVGGELVVNLDADRNVLSAGGEALPPAGVATSPGVGSAAARDAAIAAVAKDRGVSAVRLDATLPSLWIYDAAILGGPGPERPVLVWRLSVSGQDGLPIDELVLVDAQLGVVTLRIDQIETAKNRSTCDGADTATQYPCTAPVRTEGGPASPVADVNFAHDFAGSTYDLFAEFGRDSLDGRGLSLKSTARHCPSSGPCPYKNAFWDGRQMVYGQGFATDDVVGHELTHGVTDFSAHLFYYYQSGAINESLSDVFGEFVDLKNVTAADTPATRWQVGEDIPGLPPIRDMETPPNFGDPDRMTSAIYHPDETDSGGVHINSGVNNKAAFLMTDGGSFNGRTIAGLGIPKVSRIYYEVQTKMLTSASDYADLASALPQACTNLVGTGGISTADCGEVSDAVAAVEMGADPPRAPAPEAPVCDTGLVPTNLFSDDLENPGSGNWTPEVGWHYPQNQGNPYPGFDATYATSGTTNLWGDAPEIRSDHSIAMTRSIAIPPSGRAFLRFRHAYGFEDDTSGTTQAYDGGVLEHSTNGGVSWSDSGSLLTEGGYTETISTASNNPLGGRGAFVRESNGYRSSRATLTSLGGQSVRFRFRITTDTGGGDYGWFVDDIGIYTCAPPPSPDADGDGIADAGDACPSVAASTPNGCPATTGGTTATSGSGSGSVTDGGNPSFGGGATEPSAATLKTAKVTSCRLSGRGRRARVLCRLTGFGAVERANLRVTFRGRTVAGASVRPSPTGALSVKPRRSLRRGVYRVTIKLRDARGATRTLPARLRIR